MIIEFEPTHHVYSVNGNIANISVTELLRNQGLAPSLDGIKQEVLERASAEGTRVHKDLELVLNEFQYMPTTPQGVNFAKWVEENMQSGVGELMFGWEHEGFTLAGTADVVGFLKDGTPFIADHKNTAQFNRQYVTWQVNLLDYMARKTSEVDDLLNGKMFKWKGAKKFFCFHYNKKDGSLDVKELQKIPDEEIEKVLDAEYNGTKYESRELQITDEQKQRVMLAEATFSEISKVYKTMKEQVENERAKLLELFEEQGIKQWTNDKFTVSYVEAFDRTSVDSKKLKKDYPQAYADCQKLTKVKASLRVTEKGEENEEQ